MPSKFQIIQIEKIENMFHQNKKNHKNGFKSPSKGFLRSKSTENIVSPQKSIKRKNMPDKVGRQQLSITKLNSLKKSKSSNSIKIKAKTLKKNIETKSQNKRKDKKKKISQSECKTLKKVQKQLKYQFSDQSFNSEQKIKIQTSQYFFYRNTYIPIENSAQRRFVFKIKQIDQQREKSTADTFFKTNLECIALQKDSFQQTFAHIKSKKFNDTYAETQKAQIAQFGTSMTPRINTQISLQTQNNKFEENIKKCFSSTLQDIEFLFLPDENNFQGFSQIQRLHYKELFQAIAQKIWAKGQQIQQVDPQKIKFLLSQRQCIQMGMIQSFPQEGFPTHIFAVNSYLINLFQFAAIREKKLLLQRIHSIYGSTYQERLSNLLKGIQTNKKISSILSEQLFFDLENQLFGDHQFGSEIVEKSVHFHNKAIFDAVNEELQKFKPFYYSKGQPFPWSVNVGMTFFSIDQQSLGVLFKQIKEKLLIKFGYLCGILINYDNFKELPNKQKHPLHIKKIEVNELKMINDQQPEHKFDTDIQQAMVCLKAKFSTNILEYLIEQLIAELKISENK